jgi:hypothetical protein
MKVVQILAYFLLFSTGLFAQDPIDRPDIFIDCQMNCDWIYIKQEIQFVNYMQNRQEADIFVLATRQSTGAGGREVQFAFIGNKARIEYRGRFNASNITDKHKLRLSTFYNNEISTFKLASGNESFIRRRYNVQFLYVKSLGPNWSVGFETQTGSSTFGNTDLSTTFKPAIEYNIFPYSEASTRRFSLNYSIGPEYYDYTDTTIFNRVSETRMRHGLDIEFNQTQKWGNISVDIGARQYLHDLELFNAFINPNIELQIFKGLAIDVGGFVSFVNDRINIAKADISDEDILLQIRQLDTSFTYFSYLGINYRFGSSYNNFVNPRF